MGQKANKKYLRLARTEQARYQHNANPELAHWMREFGKSSTTSPHELASRKGTRRAQIRRAISDSSDDS